MRLARLRRLRLRADNGRGDNRGSASTALPTQLAQASDLLERSEQRGALAATLDGVRGTSRRRLVLVAGEAGAGKTALARRFSDEQRAWARILWGACDALFTPRALGALLDVADETGGDLAEAAAGDAGTHEVANVLVLAGGDRDIPPTVRDAVLARTARLSTEAGRCWARSPSPSRRPSSGCSRRWPPRRGSPAWTSASARACWRRRSTASPSATSWRG